MFWGKSDRAMANKETYVIRYIFSKDDVVEHMVYCTAKTLDSWVRAFGKVFTEQKPMRVETEILPSRK